MNQWYLIQFKPNSHRLAERNLLRQGFETFLPMQKITRRKVSRFVSDLKPLFPGYMFVSVNSDLAPWRTINNTIGVSKIVSFEGKPKPLPLKLISGLMLRCDASSTLLPPKRCCQTNENSHRIACAALIYALNSWRHSVRAAVRLILKLSRE